MTTLYIIRGLPGSGKSTYAKSLDVPYYEADMYFEKDGEYKFNPALLKRAHTWCFFKVGDMIEEGKVVAVSNTFTTVKELKPYVELARENGYTIVLVEVKTRYKSIHNVPEETMAKMQARWQEIPVDMYDIIIGVI